MSKAFFSESGKAVFGFSDDCPCGFDCGVPVVENNYTIPGDYPTLLDALAVHGNEASTRLHVSGIHPESLPDFTCQIDGGGSAVFTGGAPNFSIAGYLLNCEITTDTTWNCRMVYCNIHDITSVDSIQFYFVCSSTVTNINGSTLNTSVGFAKNSTFTNIIAGIGGRIYIQNIDTCTLTNIRSGQGVDATTSISAGNGGLIDLSFTGGSSIVSEIYTGNGGASISGDLFHNHNGASGGNIDCTFYNDATVEFFNIYTGDGSDGAPAFNTLGNGAGGNGGNILIEASNPASSFYLHDVILGDGAGGGDFTTDLPTSGGSGSGSGGYGGSVLIDQGGSGGAPIYILYNSTFENITFGNGGNGGDMFVSVVISPWSKKAGGGGNGGFINGLFEKCAFINMNFGNGGDAGISDTSGTTAYGGSCGGGFGIDSNTRGGDLIYSGGVVLDAGSSGLDVYICECLVSGVNFGSPGLHFTGTGAGKMGSYGGNGCDGNPGGNGGDTHSTQVLPAGIGGSVGGIDGEWISC